MKSLIKYCLFSCLILGGISTRSMAQGNINAMEYFIDDQDLGVGANPTIPITGGATVTESFTITTSGLSVGFHTVYFRVQDLGGQWSISNSRNFYVSASNLTTQANIVDVEYYIDNDPGVGGATSLGVFSSTTVNLTPTIPTSALPAGFHTINTRALDSDGIWGDLESRSFYISESDLTTQANIVDVEYYIDTDLGVGANTSLGPFSSTTVNLTPTIPTSGLPAGFHTINTRALDSDGTWGDLESRSFYVSQSDLTTQANIVDVEYFIDIDPGVGGATSLGIFSSTTVNLTPTIPTSGLAAGFHTINTRALDSDGAWGEVESRSFYVDAFAAGLITGVEYFYNTDPGYGAGDIFPIAPPVASIDQVIDLPTTALLAGPHELGIRMINDNGVIGLTDYYPINLCDVAIPDFAPDVVCLGGTTTFTDNSVGVLVGDAYSWDFDTNAVEDSNTSGTQSFAYPTDGTFTASLTIDRGGCASTTQVTVTVAPIPTSDAGVDLSFCVDNTTLSANTPSAGETGLWSLISGSGTFTNASDPNTTITGITTASNQLRWTVTNTLGGCSTFDDVVLTSNLAISAVDQTTTVDIGQSVNLDVQSSAVINAGDVLTTTITTDPVSGVATVQADGTIDYTPNEDAASTDDLIFRITNQCGNFDEKSIQITIVNQAPVIDALGFTGTPNATQLVFDLTTLISDPNNNLDFTSLRVVTQPLSGAVATIDANGVLTIDYSGVTFSGDDQIEIEICDLVGVCTTQTITISNVDVGGENPPISVFNAVSPNGDGKHDFLEIENVEFYIDNQVVVFNRWGDVVFETINYNNTDNNFVGKSDGGSDLPSGTYYYSIDTNNGEEPLTGFIMLNK